MEAKKGTAITGCATISKAVDLYSTSVSNPGTSDDERLPQNLEALANPGWSSSFLPDGERSLIDPWGNRYQAMNAVKDDGITPYILVYTTAPDGTKISQFGAGAKSRVNQ
nr:type II secretion system protein GspG [Gemmata obscuriglobus]